MNAVTIGFACYLTMVLIVGFYFARITNNLKDFTLGGQRLGPALVLSLWWKSIRKKGVLAGLICGTLFTIIPVFAEVVTPRLSAFIIGGLAVIVVSIIAKIINLIFHPQKKSL